MSYYENDRRISRADRFKPANPPQQYCATCCNTGRVYRSPAYMRDWLSERIYAAERGELDLAGLIKFNKVFDAWLLDRCVPCPECRGYNVI